MEAEAEEQSSIRGKDGSLPEAREELENVLSDPGFQCTDRNKKFLRYVSEALFEGRGDAVKAYSIAIDVFGRPSSFDPSIDPIVRIEATRLRSALLRYYEQRGREKAVRIDLPRGRYLPQFSRASDGQETSSPANEQVGPETHLAPSVETGRLHPPRWVKSIAVFTGLVGGALFGAVLLFSAGPFRGGAQPEISDKPRVSLEVESADRLSDSDAVRFRDGLMIALSRFQTLHVSAPDITSDIGEKAAHAGAMLARGSKYRLLIKFQSDTSGTSAMWQVIDRGSGETIRSGNDQAFSSRFTPDDMEKEIVSRLAVRLASKGGVINGIETAREMAHPTLGNGCVLRAMLVSEGSDPGTLRQVRDCMEETLRLQPGNADAYALLSTVLLVPSPDREASDRALEYARQAVALAPDSDRSHFALMATQFNTGNLDAAIFEGYRALNLNPNNVAGMAKLARILFTTGRWGEGVALALKADRFEYMAPPDAEMTLAFDAFRRGSFNEALFRLQQADRPDDYVAQLLSIATSARLGRMDEARALIEKLRVLHGKFEDGFRADMVDAQLTPPLVSALADGLAKAGLTLR